jgi:hypothetical protein
MYIVCVRARARARVCVTNNISSLFSITQMSRGRHIPVLYYTENILTQH